MLFIVGLFGIRHVRRLNHCAAAVISSRTDTETATKGNAEGSCAWKMALFRYLFKVKRTASEQIAYMRETLIVDVMFGCSMAIFTEEPEQMRITDHGCAAKFSKRNSALPISVDMPERTI